jgi:uncharacterized membrane protein
MNAKTFFSQVDHKKMVAAIRAAEQRTSGEIRVVVRHRQVRDAQQAALRQFLKLGMHKTRQRNAVLIFVAPESQNFAIIGDEAVHAKCGAPFWERVAEGMAGLFRRGDYTGAIVHGIEAAGELLARHFPPSKTERNELPDAIAE